MKRFERIRKIYTTSLYRMFTKKNVLAGYMLGAICMLKTSILYNQFAGSHTVCLAENSILHFADKGNAMLMILGCVLTMLDAPYIDERSFFLIHRVGRKAWYQGMWMYILTGCSLYYLIMCLIGMLPFAGNGYL